MLRISSCRDLWIKDRIRNIVFMISINLVSSYRLPIMVGFYHRTAVFLNLCIALSICRTWYSQTDEFPSMLIKKNDYRFEIYFFDRESTRTHWDGLEPVFLLFQFLICCTIITLYPRCWVSPCVITMPSCFVECFICALQERTLGFGQNYAFLSIRHIFSITFQQIVRRWVIFPVLFKAVYCLPWTCTFYHIEGF